MTVEWRLLLAALPLLAGALSPSAQAHEVRPGYLEIRQSGVETFDVLWKVPARGEYRMRLYTRFPGNCKRAASHGDFAGGAFVERWRAHCAGGLAGKTIQIEGLSATRTDVLARIEWADGTVRVERLTPERTSFVAESAPSGLNAVRTYFLLGVKHILFGFDHLMFVLGLLFLADNWRRLVATITAFTVAHSLTLFAATLGWVHVAQGPVEASIALSIVFVAAEILRRRRAEPTRASRAPWVVAFAFGLLHGFGFAGALSEMGLPPNDVPLAVLFFNVGVETGQLLFIGTVMATLLAISRILRLPRSGAHDPWRAESAICAPVAYAIGTLATFWTMQRVVGFWG